MKHFDFTYFLTLLFGGNIKSQANSTEFIEESDIEKGFSSFYEKEVKPQNINVENRRIYHLNKLLFATRTLIISWIAFFLLIRPFSTIETAAATLNIMLMGCLILISISWIKAILFRFKLEMKIDLFFNTFKFFNNFKYRPWGGSNVKKYEKFNILPSYDSKISKIEDGVIGTYQGANVNFVEIVLKGKRYRNAKHKVFTGTVILCDVGKTFKGGTIAQGGFEDNRLSANLPDLQQVSLEDLEFKKNFTIHSSNQAEAKYLLTSSFMSSLKRLYNFLESDHIEISFCEGQMLLAFHNSKDLFEPRSILKEVNLAKESKTIIKEMHLIFAVVDSLRGERKQDVIY